MATTKPACEILQAGFVEDYSLASTCLAITNL